MNDPVNFKFEQRKITRNQFNENLENINLLGAI